MKVSLNHLKELVKTDISVEELSRLFNLHSGEVEEYYQLVNASHVVVGKVLEKEPHPDANKLSVCQVDLGDEVSQIVCGAPNVEKGQMVIVSKPGAVLAGGFKIKPSKIRGVESNGMICSLVELGLDKKYVYADGIEVIKEDCKPGDNPLEVLSLEDEVMALDLTPNRADLLSVMGAAYDTAAILDAELLIDLNPKVNESSKEADITVEIDAPKEMCASYYARVIENVEIKESPQWLKSRLIAMGMRPINNVVDITNYIMLETGQPLHAFDYDTIKTKKIVVRAAKENETMITLDEQERKLTSQDIVITDGEKPVALGGVMGGLETEVSDTTTTILLESACFGSQFIRKTSRRLDLRSEASTRFERKIDPARTVLALNKAANMFEELAGGTILKLVEKNVVDNVDYSENVVHTSGQQINDNLGSTLTSEEVGDILRRLHFSYEREGDEFKVTLPSRRQDMSGYQDIVEEVGRIYGYDNLPLTLPSTVSKGELSPSQIFRRNLRRKLNAFGLNEVVTYSLINEGRINDFVKEDTTSIKVAMPMSLDRAILTSSPLMGMIDTIKYNVARKNTDVQIYEIGKRYNENEKLVVSGALTGLLSNTNWQGKKEVVDFYTVKGMLDTLLENLEVNDVTYAPTNVYKNLHPGQSAIIYAKYNGKPLEIGFIGKLHPEYAKQNDIKEVYVFELEIDALEQVRRPLKRVKEINKFPDMVRDIAVVLEETVLASDVLEAVNKAGKRMLLSSEIFDLYKGKPLEDNQKSLAIKLVFSDPKRTLETKEVDQRVNDILGVLKSKFNAELR